MAETLTERDLRALMAVVEDGRRDDPTEGLPWAVLDGLAGLVACDRISFPEADLVRGRSPLCQWVEGGERGIVFGDGDIPDGWWESVRSFRPCAYAERTGDYTSAVRWSDFYTNAELRDTRFYADFNGPNGSVHGLHAAFPTAPGHFRKISFWRDTGPDFTERDRLVVQLLRPHLYEIFADTRSIPRLTPREREILDLAAQGLRNADIARRLYISVATVRKHLENIYDRTGARTRTAAARALTHTIPPFDPERSARLSEGGTRRPR